MCSSNSSRPCNYPVFPPESTSVPIYRAVRCAEIFTGLSRNGPAGSAASTPGDPVAGGDLSRFDFCLMLLSDHRGVQVAVDYGAGFSFLKPLSTIPIRPQHHSFDVEVRFLRRVIDANQQFVLLDVKPRALCQRDELVGTLTTNDVNHFVGDKNVLGAESGHLHLFVT